MTNTALIEKNDPPSVTVSLSEQDFYSILTKAECVFAAYWQDPQGVIPTTKVAKTKRLINAGGASC